MVNASLKLAENVMRVILSFVLSIFSTHSLANFIPQKVATGRQHTCALSTDGLIKCWGANNSGQLGIGSSDDHGGIPNSMGRNLPIVNLGKNVAAKDICVGMDYSCAMTIDQKIKCWGWNEKGKLGLGRNISAIGNLPGQMGDALPFVELGADFKVTSMTCGYDHACAVNQDGKAKCWGDNSNGQLGIESKVGRGLRPDDMGDKLPFVMIEQKIQAISAGTGFSCALLGDGSFKCWGDNYYGMLGVENDQTYGANTATMGTHLPSVKLENGPYTGLSISAGYLHTCAIYLFKGNKKLKCWGYNQQGRLGTGVEERSIGSRPNSMAEKLPETLTGFDVNVIREVHPLGTFTCALTNGGKMKCWGYNGQGQLGLGDDEDRGVSAQQMGQNLPYTDLGLPVKTMGVGSIGNHGCAVLINNWIKCWGGNAFGQLGYEDGIDRGSDSDQMGENLPYVNLD